MKNSERLYLDVHVLQTVPPSCVNRDDTGSPKTAVYGGVTRARVSSQSWKRAMRAIFMEELPYERQSVRTKYLVKMIAQLARERGADEDVAEKTTALLNEIGLGTEAVKKEKKKKKDSRLGSADLLDNLEEDTEPDYENLKVLFYLSQAQAAALTDHILSAPKPSKNEAQKILKASSGVEVALFGRMVADNKELGVDAAAQVAHSLSTHQVDNEYDYFTAVDDLKPEDSAGAGHIGTVEFNSSTLYRYGTLAVHALRDNLVQGTAQAARAFVDAFVRSMPTGKQNTFANRTLPHAVLVCLRTDQPINLCGAFERPVRAGDGGYAAPSASSLVAHAQQVYDDFAGAPALSLVAGRGLDALAQPQPFKALLDNLEQELEARLQQMAGQA